MDLTEEERAKLENEIREMGEALQSAVRGGITFCLILSSKDFSTYIANAEREPMIQVLRETASRVEAEMTTKPGFALHKDQSRVRFTCEIDKDLEGPEGQRTALRVMLDGESCGVLFVHPDRVATLVNLIYREPEA